MFNPLFKVSILTSIFMTTLLTGCATKTLINKEGKYTYDKEIPVLLVEDSVVAFGRPSQPIEGLSGDTLVIAGYKNSYVLTSGATRFVTLITKLDPRYIQIRRELDFLSENNDGHFTGPVLLSYVKFQNNFSKQELDFFIQNNGTECSTESDKRMDAQRFCFEIKIKGVVFPAAKNLATLKPLSKPYDVSIYTYQNETRKNKDGLNPLQKVALFPFAVVIDVVSLPFQAAEKIFD